MTTTPAQRKSRKADQPAGVAVAEDSQKFPKTRTKKDIAAVLLAEDELTDQEIADAVGVSRRSIGKWKSDPDFMALVGNHKGQIIADALKLPSAKVHERVRNLNNIAEGILKAFALRAERYALTADTPEEAARSIFGSTTPPEAATGLFVARSKIAANGKTVTDYELDTAGIKSLESVYMHIAKQLGQWTEKNELSGPGGESLTIILSEREDGPQ